MTSFAHILGLVGTCVQPHQPDRSIEGRKAHGKEEISPASSRFPVQAPGTHLSSRIASLLTFSLNFPSPPPPCLSTGRLRKFPEMHPKAIVGSLFVMV